MSTVTWYSDDFLSVSCLLPATWIEARFFNYILVPKKYGYLYLHAYVLRTGATFATPVLCNGSNIFKVATSNRNVEMAVC